MKTIALFLLLASTGAAWAHSWYPPSCCSGDDCRPDDAAVKDVPGGLMVQGFGFVRSDDPRIQPSEDAQAHVCVSKITGKLLCVFRRPGGV